jgi:hypothetical protein
LIALAGFAHIARRGSIYRRWFVVGESIVSEKVLHSCKLLLETAVALESRFSKPQFPMRRQRDRGLLKATSAVMLLIQPPLWVKRPF